MILLLYLGFRLNFHNYYQLNSYISLFIIYVGGSGKGWRWYNKSENEEILKNPSHRKINSFLPFPDDHYDILLEGNESFTFQTMSFGTLI